MGNHTRLPHTLTTHETQKIKMKRCRIYALITFVVFREADSYQLRLTPAPSIAMSELPV